MKNSKVHFWFCPKVMYVNERQLKCTCKEKLVPIKVKAKSSEGGK